jgi:hypothetical protein
MRSLLRRAFPRLAGVLVASTLATAVLAIAGGAAVTARSATAPVPDFGPNVKIFDPSMSPAEIKETVDAIAAEQTSNEFGAERYALLFMPGTYGSAGAPLNFEVGYYTDVSGLGASPKDVIVNGTIDTYARCDVTAVVGCTSLANFWRSLSNLTINVAGKQGTCRYGQFWAVSQAAPMRRVDVNGYTVLTDYCGGWSHASGGFIADSRFANSLVVNGLQQQHLVRNSRVSGWTNAVWNQVFAGVQGAPRHSFPTPQYTTLDTNPVSREKPFLYVDSTSRFRVFVPDVRLNAAGTSWQSGQTPGRSLPIESFFIAQPTDSAQAINAALAQGKHLLLTPGVYKLDRTIKIDRPDTIVLGLGLATLDVLNGVVAMAVADVPGVEISGLIFDAGPTSSPALLQVGSAPGAGGTDAADPTVLHDVYFRIGGPHVGKATVSLLVNSDNVILDHIWAWRADHGSGVSWWTNTAETGVVVNGNNVTAAGLFVEHFQQYSLRWNGENGRTILFQNELPWDPPTQADWSHDGVLGYAAYKVADSVKAHEAWGLISACFFPLNPKLRVTRAFEAPKTPGVKLRSMATVSIQARGTIERVVNDVGTPTDAKMNPSNVAAYP